MFSHALFVVMGRIYRINVSFILGRFPNFSKCYSNLVGYILNFQGVLAIVLTVIYCKCFKFVLDWSVGHRD